MFTKMNFILFSIVLTFIALHGVEGNIISFVQYPEDADLNTEEIILKYGFPLEVHYVTTKDGYILKIHRIPVSSQCKEDKSKPLIPIVAFHGIASSSRSYLLTENGSGFAFARNCYDVWLPNFRGNYESTNHTFLDPKKPQFWYYSFEEKGIYDIPAVIDYVISKTNSSQIHYVGHSEGTTDFFAMASLLPDYSTRTVKSMHAVCPTIFFKNPKGPILYILSRIVRQMQHLSKLFGITHFGKAEYFTPTTRKFLCTIQNPYLNICAQLNFFIFGYDFEGFNATSLLNFVSNYPAGSGVMDLLHLFQLRKSGNFSRYDYWEDNMKIYGQSTPPDYPIERIRVPMYYYASDNDFLVAVEDVKYLAKLTPTSTIVNNKDFANFNHLDFLLTNNVEAISSKILENVKLNE